MAIVIEGSIATAFTAGDSVTRPSGQTENELLLAFVTIEQDNQDFTTPWGWTLAERYDSGDVFRPGSAVFYRLVEASPPSSDTWDATSSVRMLIEMLRISGNDTTTPIDTSGQAANSITAPSVTVANNSSLLVTYALGDGGSDPAWTEPSGMAEHGDYVGTVSPMSGSNADFGSAYLTVSSGSTGTKAFSFNGSNNRAAYSIVVAPSGGGGGGGASPVRTRLQTVSYRHILTR